MTLPWTKQNHPKPADLAIREKVLGWAAGYVTDHDWFIQKAIAWWQSRGEDPTQKLVIFSDGLDVEKIEELHRQFVGRVRVSFGWGPLLTNDFRGLVPNDGLAPFSLVCKAVEANGRPTVKLSDNPAKAMGPADQIDRYKRVFNVGAQDMSDVLV